MPTTLEWAVSNIRLPKGAKWDFQDRRWQLDIINDGSQKIVCRKPTQVGMSTVFLIKMLHFADENTCRLLYTLPRQDDVYDMVNSRLHDIITESPYISNAIAEIDNVRMKKYKKSWLHFIEMSVPPRMLDADWMLNDEVDLSNQQFLQQAISRLDASKIGVHHQISTPSIEGFGIDALYEISDKKQWFVTCGYCNYEQVMDWHANVELNRGDAYYKCTKCGNKLYPEDIRDGRWVATGDTNSGISGYQISQLMIPSITPKKLYQEYRTIERKTFYNYRLGMPYTPASAAFDKEHLSTRCIGSDTRKELFNQEDSQYVIGCDQGNVLHYCVMKTHQEYSEIVLLGTTESFDEIVRLTRIFNARLVVLDALPNHHSAMQVADEFRGKVKLAFFGNADKIYSIKEDRIFINKTDAYDMLLQEFVDSAILFYTEGTSMLPPEVALGIAHLCNMRRDIDTQTSRIGGSLTFHTWKCVGPDHYADAILYAMIAADVVVSKGRLDIKSVDVNHETYDMRMMRNIYAMQMKISDMEPVLPGVEGSELRLINHGLAHANPYVNRRGK